jgi:hypothetical protein
MADNVTDCKDEKEKEKQQFLFYNRLKGINVENGEIGTKTEEQDRLGDKGIIIGCYPPKGNDQ